MIDMNFRVKLAAYVLGYLSEKDLADIALAALSEGIDSDSIRILAGMNSSDDPFELRMYFESALAENNLVLTDIKEALEIYITLVIQKINSFSLSPYQGFREIDDAVSKTAYYFDSLGLMDCYINYIEIGEIKTGGAEFYPREFSPSKYIAEKEQEMLEKLNLWVKNVDP